ncbi:MAG: hypothetical protein AAGI66_03720 [Cyanobacteria bacterium P01_H01_bin.74]
MTSTALTLPDAEQNSASSHSECVDSECIDSPRLNLEKASTKISVEKSSVLLKEAFQQLLQSDSPFQHPAWGQSLNPSFFLDYCYDATKDIGKNKETANSGFDDTLSIQLVPDGLQSQSQENLTGPNNPQDRKQALHSPVKGLASPVTDDDEANQNQQNHSINIKNTGGLMADLSGYKDLSKAPVTFGDEEELSISQELSSPERTFEIPQVPGGALSAQQHFSTGEQAGHDADSEFSGNVKTLIRLVNELPEGVTKQTGAQIIRLTMEAMGISMEDVLSEAQSAQSEMLDAVRANIKKIEEYKTVIRKLETDIKYYQGKANELSEIIDLFILSNTTGNKQEMMDA